MFANSKKQELAKHSVAVANLAVKLFDNLDFSKSSQLKRTFDNVEALRESIFFAGLFHDIGKVDSNFQGFIAGKKVNDVEEPSTDGVHFLENKENDKFSFNNYPRHNELSWAMASKLGGDKGTALYAIYFHHAKVKRAFDWSDNQMLEIAFPNSNELENICNTFFDEVLKCSNCFPNYIDSVNKWKNNIHLLSTTDNKRSVPNFLFDDVSVPSYKGDKILEKDFIEASRLLIRSLVVSADRLISSLSVKELNEAIEDNYFDHLLNFSSGNNNLENAVSLMLEKFSVLNETNPLGRERDKAQAETAKNLADKKGTATLFGPAGCGKTKMFLEWYKNKVTSNPNDLNKKLYIIAPRKMICSSLFDELCKDYVPTAKIEILTGDTKRYYAGDEKPSVNIEDMADTSTLQSDIVITTIDQLVSVMLSHKNIDLLYEFLNSYVVFDEYHEFFNISGIVLLFKIFIKLRNFKNNSKTLLVSATPNYYFLEDVLGVKVSSSVCYIDTFNKQQYDFVLSQYIVDTTQKNQLSSSILYEKQPEGTIVVFNTAKEAQTTTLVVNDEDVVCFHSKFTGEDKAEIYKVIKSNWSKKDPACQKVLRAGPIVQASLNISTMNLITQLCPAENNLQRFGRGNRFASNVAVGKLVLVASSKSLNGESTGNAEASFLDRIAQKNQTFAWIDFLKNRYFLNDVTEVRVTLTDLYDAYKEFHSMESTKEAYKTDFQKIIEDSFKIFSRNDFTPIQYWKPAKKKSKAQKMSSKSIRGSSVFVLPVRYDIYTKKIGDWLYIPSENTKPIQLLSLSEDELVYRDDVFNKQIKLLESTRINGFTEATYANCKAYAKFNPTKIKLEAKNSTSPLLLSFSSDIPNYKQLNTGVLMYVTKGRVKVGLYEINI